MKSASDVLGSLSGGLIVSVQAYADSVLNEPAAIALLSRCAAQNGAAGVRIEGSARIAAVRAAIDLPIVGIIKREHDGFAPYITSTAEEIAEVADAGAGIVAFDATARERSGGLDVAGLVAAAHDRGLLAMADCATAADVREAVAAGADVVATTLCGFTPETRGRPLPALDLVAAVCADHPFVVCEGGIATPEAARAAFAAGASAIVVGTAITNVDALVRRFASATPRST
jgi:N-acylglucosamine-6-phosphate 2-epimerase